MNALSAIPRLGQLMAVALILTGSHAFGQSTITQTGTFTNLADPVDQSLSFNQFNPALGTLTSVTINLTNVFVTGTASVTNNGAASHNYIISLAGEYDITDSLGNNVDVLLTTPTYPSGSLAPTNTFTTPSETNATAGSGTVVITGAGLTPYIGLGTTGTEVNLTSSNGVTVTGSAPYSTMESSLGSGDYSLVYTYTPVPEPSKTAAWMLGLAMCVLVGRNYFQRRRLCLA